MWNKRPEEGVVVGRQRRGEDTVPSVSIGHSGAKENKYIYFTWSKIPSISM